MLVLASSSPRRRELLAQIGLECEVVPVNVDETVSNGETALAYTQRMARKKAGAGLVQAARGRIILAADTVVCIDRQILAKPDDKQHAMAMLDLLSGRKHSVITSFALVRGERWVCTSCTTDVWLAEIDAAQRDAYWCSGEPRDKAGAYAIQGRAAVFVERIAGSYSNVVGLPLYELAEALRVFGVDSTTPKQLQESKD